MRKQINEEVSVVLYYGARKKQVIPYLLYWQNKDYYLGKVDYYHSYMEGRERQHVFELTDKEETMHFKLRFDSSNLHWILEAVHDGLAN
jgi:hypothetical protein